jgi:integrase/recombinase XerC
MTDVTDGLRGVSAPDQAVAELSLATVISEYLRFYAEGTGHTARAKRLDTDKFMAFLCRHRHIDGVQKLTVGDWDFSACQRFVDESLKHEAPATVARRLATLKHIGRTLAERIPGFINPVREVKPPRVQNSRPQSLSSAEVTEIRHNTQQPPTKGGGFSAQRNRFLLDFMLDTGLRADEVRTLKRSQIDDKFEWIREVKTKGRRFRDVYISSQMRPALQEYLTQRGATLARFFKTLAPATDGKLPLFISAHGADTQKPHTFQMSPKSVWRAVRGCSVDTKLHPHLLRHTFAVDLLEDSKDIRLVAQALGHSDVRVTMRYTERGKEQVAEALERARRGRPRRDDG